MKLEKRRQTLFFVSLIGIITVILIMGTTYAYQTLQVEYENGSDNDMVLDVGKLNVSFEKTNVIEFSNMPILPDYKTVDYTEFTIKTNDTTSDIAYEINLINIDYGYITGTTKTYGCRTATSNLQAACLVSEDFKYTITELIDEEEVHIATGDFSELTGTQYRLKVSNTDYNFIEKGKDKTLRLYLWFKQTKEPQDYLENTYFKGKIEVTSVYKEEINPYTENTLAHNIYMNSKNNLNGTELSLTNQTKIETNNSDEKILGVTQDDNGDTYYFRGNVSDNYVNFAGLCWRIVRIDENGSVKLILEDYDQECNSKDDSGNYDMDGNWSDGNNIYFDSPNHKLNFINFSGGEADSLKTFQSILSTKISDKYENKTITDYLTIEEWCYDDTVGKTEGWGFDDDFKKVYTEKEATYQWFVDEYYGTNIRIEINKEPSLKCTGTKITKFSDDSYMYVGTLTADEVSFAGSHSSTNNDYYLKNNYSKSNALEWWTLSPSHYFDSNGDVYQYNVDSNGSLNKNLVYMGRLSRPAVLLKPEIMFSEGEGTQKKPYIIN